jgi:hypothetical protein
MKRDHPLMTNALMRALAILAVLLLGIAPAAAQFSMMVQGPAAAAGYTATFVQSGAGSAYSGSTATETLAGVGAGHLLLIAVCAQPNTLTLSGVTVGGNAATLFSSSTGTAGSDNCRGAEYANSPSGSVAVVATFSGTCGSCQILAEEYSGFPAGSTLDGSNATYTAAGSTSVTVSSGSFTTTAAGDLIWAVMLQPESVAPTLESGYTAGTAGTASAWWSEHLSPQSAPGATNPNFSTGADSYDNFVIGAGIKP